MNIPKLSIAAIFFALVAFVAIPTDAEAQVQDEVYYQELIAAFETMDEQVTALEQAPVEHIQTVNVGDIKENLGDEQKEALKEAHREADTDAFKAALSERADLVAALNDEDVTVDEVVAVNIGEGSVLVFFDPSTY